MKTLLLAASLIAALTACSRVERLRPTPTGPLSEQPLLYFPTRDRALAVTDNSENDMKWQPVGMVFPALLGKVRFVLVLTDTPLVDRDGVSKGRIVAEGTRLALLEAGEWYSSGPDFHRMYRVRVEAPGSPETGWIDSSSAALMLVQAGTLAIGLLPRKIVVGGGESEYSLLVVEDGKNVSLVDTSVFCFPDSFHPSGVASVALEDINFDSQPEILLEAETIVSLRFLGSTPVRWKAWLRHRDDNFSAIFRYNESFGSDTGYSYKATDRLFDSSGSGRRDMARVDTAYTVVSGVDEFRTDTVSFYPWDGREFKRAPLEDLPKMGTVKTEKTALLARPGAGSSATATLARGTQVYVFDRSDTRLSRRDPASWWYKAVTKTGVEGWIIGTSVELSWIDAMKVNRAAFLGPG